MLLHIGKIKRHWFRRVHVINHVVRDHIYNRFVHNQTSKCHSAHEKLYSIFVLFIHLLSIFIWILRDPTPGPVASGRSSRERILSDRHLTFTVTSLEARRSNREERKVCRSHESTKSQHNPRDSPMIPTLKMNPTMLAMGKHCGERGNVAEGSVLT